MESLNPENNQRVIHVKRKRDDEPIDALFLASTSIKRARQTQNNQFIFKRDLTAAPIASLPPTPPQPPPAAHVRTNAQGLVIGDDGIPAILGSAEGDEVRDPLSLRQSRPVSTPVVNVPARRHVVVQTSAESKRTFAIAEDSDVMDVDNEFVYDVFVRAPETGFALATNVSGPEAVGTLTVAEADDGWLEELWDGSDDEAVHSDDEDSNAEDYYGADYPDDEDDDFNSGDEYEREDDEYVADYDDHFQAASYR
ncbi:hypothetical protein BT63DRAFT_450093 [Microthyrium microscopicum]|uniref:Transcription factor Iwr1 domain-containing protein n=1 Tax=Microthyrium microscopicum TaxID=703497 RepID=A0A6A6UUG2_9PEZI|nr:hypothetical protein BT63DRAFT_450093 [Microthyrium microscopicum]